MPQTIPIQTSKSLGLRAHARGCVEMREQNLHHYVSDFLLLVLRFIRVCGSGRVTESTFLSIVAYRLRLMLVFFWIVYADLDLLPSVCVSVLPLIYFLKTFLVVMIKLVVFITTAGKYTRKTPGTSSVDACLWLVLSLILSHVMENDFGGWRCVKSRLH